MKSYLINFLQNLKDFNQVTTSLSLMPFVKFLQQKIDRNDSVSIPYFKYVLKQIQSMPDWDTVIERKDIAQYNEIFELIYYTFSPPVIDESEDVWALAEPLSPVIYCGTTAFYNLISNEDGTLKANLTNEKNAANNEITRLKIIYSFILKQLYGFSSTLKSEVIQSFNDELTGLHKFFKLEFDTQFIDIKYDGEIPKIDFTVFRPNLFDDSETLDTLQKLLPLKNLSLEGFSIVHFKDVTKDYTIEHIKDVIVNFSKEQKVYTDIIHSLKNLFSDSDVDLKLLPILKVNDKLAMDSLGSAEQHLIEQCGQYGFDKEKYLEAIVDYVKNPKSLFYPDIDIIQPEESSLVPFLRQTCIKSFSIMPIFFQKKLVGILEIFSGEKNKVSPQNLIILNPVIPLLERLLHTIITDFDVRLDNIIKENFTSLQPSVQWRFNEAAWEFLQKKDRDNKAEIAHIYFPKVWPLYGAIDIRNSTKQRNEALQRDMYCHLNLLINLLLKIKEQLGTATLDDLISKVNKWRSQINEFITPDDEYRLLHFIENEVKPTLLYFHESKIGFEQPIEAYFKATSPDGETFINRRQLEEDMQLLNVTISNALEELNGQIQSMYPCYFEKFRSDGIEYDIYIGQSITPHKLFNLIYIRNLRLWQLVSMAEITQKTHHLLLQLPKKLETTQLIFIHPNTIDISFRNDERRFDVEGAYNIRYEIVKKRIDKVCVKSSSERLTQPGTIALVYFHQNDIEEYVSNIRIMQAKGILADKIEYLDLEELQGVSGLKALRLYVNLE